MMISIYNLILFRMEHVIKTFTSIYVKKLFSLYTM